MSNPPKMEHGNAPGCGDTSLLVTELAAALLADSLKSPESSLFERSRITPVIRLGSPPRSGCAHRIEEFSDLALEPITVGRQHLRRGEHLRGGRTGLGRATLHVGDVGGDLLGALGGLLHVARNFLR